MKVTNIFNIKIQLLFDKIEEKKIKKYFFNDFFFTIDNNMKMILIDIKLEFNIPIVLMGETGCGKTYLIKMISELSDVKFSKMNIHFGITEEHIINYMNQFKKEEKKVYIFFDEINTSNVIGLISEIFKRTKIK